MKGKAYFAKTKMEMILSTRCRYLFVLLLSVCLSVNSLAQFNVSVAQDPVALVNDILLSDTPGIEVLKVSYFGASPAVGSFDANLRYSDMMSSGIILSTGSVMDASGPNESGHTSGSNYYPGRESLSKLAGNKATRDAASLKLQFRALSDSISFRYLFASEEYPEYVNRGVNDVFGFFLTDKSTGKRQNLAVLQDGKTTICVDNIHSRKNKKLYRKGGLWTKSNMETWKTDSATGERALMLEYDGFTVVLSAGVALVPGRLYELEMAIADVGDTVYDSAIFLEAGSFKANGEQRDPIGLDLVKLFDKELFTGEDGVKKGVRNVQFEFGSSEVHDVETLAFLKDLASLFEQEHPSWSKIEIVGHTDTVGTDEENLVLSQKRAQAIVEQLIRYGIPRDKLVAKGKGEGLPLSAEEQEKNRRVEFFFY